MLFRLASHTRTLNLSHNARIDGILVQRDPFEAVAAGAVERAPEFSIGRSDAVGGIGSERLFIEYGFRFSALKLSGLAVWTARAAFVGRCCRNVSAASLDLKKLLDTFQSPTTALLHCWRVGDNHAVGGSSKQNHAEWS